MNGVDMKAINCDAAAEKTLDHIRILVISPYGIYGLPETI